MEIPECLIGLLVSFFLFLDSQDDLIFSPFLIINMLNLRYNHQKKDILNSSAFQNL